MNFGESISTCFSKYASFSGRATRPEYWWWILFIVIGTLSTGAVSEKLSAAFSLATLLPSVAVAARRLHDTDRSGWFQLVGIVPIVGWLLMVYWCAQEAKEPNQFGAGAAG